LEKVVTANITKISIIYINHDYLIHDIYNIIRFKKFMRNVVNWLVKIYMF